MMLALNNINYKASIIGLLMMPAMKKINYKASVTGTFDDAKGQLNSKCPYEKSVSSKIPMKIFLDFCPEFFCSFLGASW